jgi:formylglycine-generating enzyme required for sulfatase activity
MNLLDDPFDGRLPMDCFEDAACGLGSTYKGRPIVGTPPKMFVSLAGLREKTDGLRTTLGDAERPLFATILGPVLRLGYAPPDELRAQAVAAVTLMRLGRSDPIWRFLGKVPEPDVRTELIAAFQRFHISARELIEHLDVERDSVVRYSLLLALGEYYFEGLNEAERNVAAARVGELYSDDDDPGVHSAAAWLLGVWKQPVAPVAVAPEDKRNWHVTSEGHVMCELSGPVTFQKGSPETEAGRDHIETLHDVNIPHAFAISTHEVTIDEFRRFEPSHPFAPEIGPEGTCPVNKVSWIAAARYCNWLSRRAGMSDDELVYPLVPTITDGLRVPAENLNRHGYRLPTEDEWEFACRAGARTKWFFGQSDAPLPRFGRYLANSDEHTWPVGQLRPNPFGLFDTYGNVHEWCHDTYDGNDAVSAIVRTDVDLGGPDVRPGERLFRGGSYRSMTRLVRTAKRYSYPPNTNLSPLGFRIARTMPD